MQQPEDKMQGQMLSPRMNLKRSAIHTLQKWETDSAYCNSFHLRIRYNDMGEA